MTTDEMIGADVTISGVVYKRLPTGDYAVKVRSGHIIFVEDQDFKTIRPKEPEIKEDKRRGR